MLPRPPPRRYSKSYRMSNRESGRLSMTITTLRTDLYGKPAGYLYPPDMVKRVLRGIQEMRLQLGDVFKGIEERDEHAVFARRGKPVAVLVPIEWYRQAAKAMNDPTEY